MLSLHDITLSKWIAYTDGLKPLDVELRELNEGGSYRKPVLLTGNHVKRAYYTKSFFDGVDIGELRNTLFVDDCLKWYATEFGPLMDNAEVCTSWNDMQLTAAAITPTSPITFGEFIDAKMLTQAASNSEQNKWALVQYIAAIFLRDEGEDYNDLFTDENSDRFKLMADLPMNVAIAVGQFFEDLNKHVDENFTVFQDSGEDDGSEHMKQHMRQWGWVNFLKTIAKEKVFDIPGSGLNSIDCARKAKAFDVLTWASESKDFSVAQYRDMEERSRK